MWSVSQLCRCSAVSAPSRLLLSGARNNFSSALNKQLFTSSRSHGHKLGLSNRFRLTELIKSNGVILRLCSTAPKPKTSKVVGYWLLGCSGMVFTAVVLGGVTRLTESGLSMVTWRLLGEAMPRTEAEWIAEFDKYQQYPEFKYKNQSMTLSQFKWIWYMEYAHRWWGRCVGGAVLLPTAALWLLGRLDSAMKLRCSLYCALVAAQGLMGWHMVKSGLEDRFQDVNDVPRVSQHRLAAHLGLAFLLYAGLLAGALRVLRPSPLAQAYAKVRGLAGLTATAHTVKAMAFLTALSGAFVAGLDAGLVYNSFPKMGDRWVPEEVAALRSLREASQQPAAVQLAHRLLAASTLLAATALPLLARRRPPASPAAAGLVWGVAAMAWLQASLGVLTLLNYVPTPLAASHQSGSLVLLSLAIWLTHEIKLLKYIPK